MAISEECGKLVRELGRMTREKGWSYEDGRMLAMFCASINMQEAAGGDCAAVKKAMEFLTESKDSSECFYKVLEYIGTDMSHWDDEPDDDTDDDQ